MDFAALPPEINSGRMYTGPGSGPIRAAAAAWDGLAAEMSQAASDYGSAIADMVGGPWRGPASMSMAAAAAPYVTWMRATAAQAAQSATQAKAAAAAYESAFTMTVPPLVIAANRAQLAALVATNFLGQNTAAIAAAEAQYAEMWAQDAAAMYGYASSSAAASTLTPFTAPPPTTSGAAGDLAGMHATLSQLVSSMPAALQGLAAPGLGATTPMAQLGEMEGWIGLGGADFSTPAGILNFLAGTDGSSVGAFLNDNGLNTMFSSGFYMPGNFLGTMSDFVGLQGAGAAADAAGAAAGDAAAAGAGDVGNAASGLGAAASAGAGNAASIGPLSVPPAWTAAPSTGAAASALPPAAAGIPATGPGLSSMLGGCRRSPPRGVPSATSPATGSGPRWCPTPQRPDDGSGPPVG